MSQAVFKKAEKIKKKKGWFRRYLAFCEFIFFWMLLVVLFFGAYWAIKGIKQTYSSAFSALWLTGDYRFTTKKDIQQAMLATGTVHSFMEENVYVLQEEIKRFPWIKQVNVRRRWPDKLEIHLSDYVPVARWNDLYLLDHEGKIFSVPRERMSHEKLLLLYGPEGTEQNTLAYYRAMSQLLQTYQFHLKMVAMSARHSWQLVLDNDIRLEIGRTDIMPRLKRFIELYPFLKNPPNQRINYIDLRYKNGAAVDWSPVFVDPQDTDADMDKKSPP